MLWHNTWRCIVWRCFLPHFKLLPKESQAVLDAFNCMSRIQGPKAKQSSQRASDFLLAPALAVIVAVALLVALIIQIAARVATLAVVQPLSEFVPSEDVSDIGATSVYTCSTATKRSWVLRTVSNILPEASQAPSKGEGQGRPRK